MKTIPASIPHTPRVRWHSAMGVLEGTVRRFDRVARDRRHDPYVKPEPLLEGSHNASARDDVGCSQA